MQFFWECIAQLWFSLFSCKCIEKNQKPKNHNNFSLKSNCIISRSQPGLTGSDHNSATSSLSKHGQVMNVSPSLLRKNRLNNCLLHRYNKIKYLLCTLRFPSEKNTWQRRVKEPPFTYMAHCSKLKKEYFLAFQREREREGWRSVWLLLTLNVAQLVQRILV